MGKSIKKFKYLLLIVMNVFVLTSCSYIWNEFKDTVDEMKHEGEKKRRIPKNDDYAIRNPNYTDDVKKLLKEIEKREITKNDIAFENLVNHDLGASLEMLIPEGTKIRGSALIDEKTGYGLPINIMISRNTTPTITTCYGIATKRENKLIYEISVSDNSARHLAQKIAEKNGIKLCK